MIDVDGKPIDRRLVMTTRKLTPRQAHGVLESGKSNLPHSSTHLAFTSLITSHFL